MSLAVLALLAFMPSAACACLETYRLSPVRMVFAGQLLALLFAGFAVLPARRLGWITAGGVVIVGSWLAALLAAGLAVSAVAAGAVALVPIYVLAVVAWSRSRNAAQHREDKGAGRAA